MAAFSCEHCGHNKTVPDSYVGKRAKCPKCGQSSIVQTDPASEPGEGEHSVEPPQFAFSSTDSSNDNPDWDAQEAAESTPTSDRSQINPTRSAANSDNHPHGKAPTNYHGNVMIAINGVVAVLLAIVVAVLLAIFVAMNARHVYWQYKTVEVLAEVAPGAILDNQKALAYKAIPDQQTMLNKLGEEGWELVSTFIEHETAHPNFGKEDYVTGLQPNTRPQRLVCIFKKPR